jgi:hypothetical protein
MGKPNNASSCQNLLDTLGQNGTAQKRNPIIVVGEGTDLKDKNALKGRAKRKSITNAMSLSLIDIANIKKDKNMEQALWNTFHCQEQLISADGRQYGKYCKNRFCTLCCSIRKAEIINRYLPIIETWVNPYFVTLTVRACPKKYLKKMVDGVDRAFKLIYQKIKKRNQRKKGIRLIGIKSLECNFNSQRKTYNPHLHLIVQNEEMADLLINEWLTLWTPKFTLRCAQYKRGVKDKGRDLMEIVKYGSKIFAEPELKNKALSKSDRKIYIRSLYNIFTAMKDHRIFERFGFNTPKKDKVFGGKSKVCHDYENWRFDPKQSDWINKDTGEALTSYLLPPELRVLLEQNIDKILE